MIFAIVFLLVALVPDLYIYLWLIRDASLVLRILHWVPLGLILLLGIASFSGFSGISHQVLLSAMFAIVLLFALPKFFFMIISLLGRLVSLLWAPAARGGDWLGLAVAAVVLCASFYGFAVGWRRIVVHEKEVELEGLPAAFDGYRLVQLSDFHIGTYHMSPKTVDRIVEIVNGMDADAVVFTGDLVNSHPSEAEPFKEKLAQLRAKDGVISIMGNHDYCEYYHFKSPVERAAAIARVQEIEREVGWDLLLDENRIIRRAQDSLAVIGVENVSKPPFPSYGDLTKAQAGLPEGIFKILLTHDPSHWRMEVLPDSDVQFTLSGHTHAMQLQFGNFSPACIAYPEWGGFYSEGERILHVSVGNGSNVPFRLGAWPEIVLLTLRRK